MHIYDLLDQEELAQAIEAKHVREQFHPTEPLAILNYSEACVYDNGWNDTTLNCRGFIYNTTDGSVVARPFSKFFNYGQTGAAEIPLDAAVSVTDKIDGSMGALYRRPSDNKYAIATRGSFTSEQALHATKRLWTLYGVWALRFKQNAPDDETLVYEILYPENRIVLDYQGLDDLVLLGSVDIETGVVDEPHIAKERHGWQGPVTEVFEYRTLAEALSAPPRENVEGYVVRRIEGRLGAGLGDTIKLKTESYIQLHRLVTGLSERTVWEQIVAGATLQEIIEPLPDEFHDWVREVEHRLRSQVNRRHQQIITSMSRIVDELNDNGGAGIVRKEFALKVKDLPDAWAYFSLMDSKPILPKLWEQAKPDAFLTPSGRTYTEEAA